MSKTKSESSFFRIFKNLSDQFLTAFNQIKMTEHTFVLSVAVIIGIVAGLGAVLIQFAIKEFQLLFWQGEFNLTTIQAIPWWWKLAVPVFGGLVSSAGANYRPLYPIHLQRNCRG